MIQPEQFEHWVENEFSQEEHRVLYQILRLYSKKEEDDFSLEMARETLMTLSGLDMQIGVKVLVNRLINPVLEASDPEEALLAVAGKVTRLLEMIQSTPFQQILSVICERRQEILGVVDDADVSNLEEDEIDPELPDEIRTLFFDSEILFLQVLRDESGSPVCYTAKDVMAFIKDEEEYDIFMDREENDPNIERYCAWYREHGFPNLRFQISEAGRCLTQTELAIPDEKDDQEEALANSGSAEDVEDGAEETVDREPTDEELAEEAALETGSSMFPRVVEKVLLHIKVDVVYRKSELYGVLPDPHRQDLSEGEEMSRLSIGENFTRNNLVQLNYWLNHHRPAKTGMRWSLEYLGNSQYALKEVPAEN